MVGFGLCACKMRTFYVYYFHRGFKRVKMVKIAYKMAHKCAIFHSKIISDFISVTERLATIRVTGIVQQQIKVLNEHILDFQML